MGESTVDNVVKTKGTIRKTNNMGSLFSSTLELFLFLIKRYKNNIRLSISKEYPIGPNVLKILGTK